MSRRPLPSLPALQHPRRVRREDAAAREAPLAAFIPTRDRVRQMQRRVDRDHIRTCFHQEADDPGVSPGSSQASVITGRSKSGRVLVRCPVVGDALPGVAGARGLSGVTACPEPVQEHLRTKRPDTTKATLRWPSRSQSAGLQGSCKSYALVGLDSGGGIRTRDLRVMSPTSYQTAPPRVAPYVLANMGRRRPSIAHL
jgi:hypothetical protein